MPDEIGCSHCWPADAELAWKARSGLARLEELVDESHFHVTILGCRRCEQRFVSVFTETVDWADGDDPQYWAVLPITRSEADDLIAQGASVTEARLSELDASRRCLRRDFPKGGAPRVFWGHGVFGGPMD